MFPEVLDYLNLGSVFLFFCLFIYLFIFLFLLLFIMVLEVLAKTIEQQEEMS